MADLTHSLKIVDILGKPKHDLVRLPGTMTIAQVAAWSLLYQAAIDPILDGVITEATVTFAVPLATGDIKDTANAGSRVRRGAEFLFAVPTSVNNHGVFVPSLLPSLLDAGLDPYSSPVVAWVNAMIDGLTVAGTVYQPTNGSGDDLTSLLKYAETYRK